MQHPAIGHDDAKSAVTFREMRKQAALDVYNDLRALREMGDESEEDETFAGRGVPA
jgi:hypothetical protein